MTEVRHTRWISFRRIFSPFKNRNVLILTISGFIYGLSAGMTKPVLPILLSVFSTTPGQVGFLMSVVGIIAMFSMIPTGWLSDLTGKKNVIMMLLMLSAIPALTFAIASDILYFLIALVLMGLTATYGAISQALVMDSVGRRERGISIGLIMAAPNLGALVFGPSIGGFLAHTFDLRTPFFGRLLLTSAVFVLILIFVREVKLEDHNRERSEQQKTPTLSFWEKMRILFTNKAILICGLIFFATGIWSSVTGTFLALFCKEVLRMDIAQIGFVFSLAGIAVPIMQVSAGKVSDAVGRVKVVVLGTFVASGAISLIPMTTSPLTLSSALLIFNVFAAIKDPGVVALAGDASGRIGRGKVVGLIYNLFFVGVFFGNNMGGLLYDLIDPRAPFFFASFWGIFASLLAALFIRRGR